MQNAAEWLDCPVCGGKNFTPLFEKKQEQFVRCNGCGLVMINPRPQYRQIAQTYEFGYSERYVAKAEKKLRRAHRRVRQMRKYVARGRWLDIGCSAGFVASAAQQGGYEAYGADVDTPALEYGRRHFGLQHLYQGFFEDVRFPDGHFDVITLYEVIEHVPDLNKTVAELARILSPAGVMEIWTPDVGHWRRPEPLENWDAILPSEHLYYFNFKTLSLLLRKHGFCVIKKRFNMKPGLKVYVRHAGE
ncbi:MAG: class I SAM-dependent methyltransferase [Gammaproteobacteria bacterium]|nr:MAG: class I SAM-dependent methyltransferase [Gammaproteobacteria bacterium]